MKEIKAWQTNDGSVFGEKIEAELHEQKLQINERIKEFTEKYYFPNMTKSDFKDALTEFYIQNE